MSDAAARPMATGHEMLDNLRTANTNIREALRMVQSASAFGRGGATLDRTDIARLLAYLRRAEACTLHALAVEGGASGVDK